MNYPQHIAVLLLLAQAIPAVEAPPGYTLVYADEFDGQAVDERAWNYREGLRTGPNIDAWNHRDAVAVRGGALAITCTQETVEGRVRNLGGGLISRARFGYGWYETVCTPYHASHGVHPAFWARGLPAENNLLFEIDGFECDSAEPMMSHNLYVIPTPRGFDRVPWPSRLNRPLERREDGSFISAWEYTPEGVRFFHNGRLVSEATAPGLVGAQNVWLTALNGVGNVDPSGFPGVTTFDYFRYFAKPLPGVNLLPNGDFVYNFDRIDPQEPVCWDEAFNRNASRVVTTDAPRGTACLRQGLEDHEWQVTTHQDLHHLLPGTYELTGLARASGGLEWSRLWVSGHGGPDVVLDLPQSAVWRRATLPTIPVTSGTVRIAIEGRGPARTWSEVDDLRFRLSAPGPAPAEADYTFVADPIWTAGTTAPMTFTGDGSFLFFDRNVGRGEAISIDAVVTLDRLDDLGILARQPRTGTAGWALLTTADGTLVVQLGSQEDHVEVRSPPGALVAGRRHRLVAVVESGTVHLWIDGHEVARRSGLTHTTDDATAAGRLGQAGGAFQAVGDVMVRRGSPTEPAFKPFAGRIGPLAIHNRALAPVESTHP